MFKALSTSSSGPCIRKVRGRLIISTRRLTQVLTLGLYFRRVTIDPGRETFFIRGRYGWFVHRRRRIRFGEVRAVTYGYDHANRSVSWESSHQSWDHFRVGLRLHDLEEIHLCSFSGPGGPVDDNPFPDWLDWDEYLPGFQGSQESESRAFVDLLCHMLQVEVIPPAVW